MVKRWKKYIAALGFGIFLFSTGEASAIETYYLNNDVTLPMIQNTGGIYNDGHTGLFMDLSTVAIDGVYKDGLSVEAKVLELSAGSLVESRMLHVRCSDTGKNWVLQDDGKWQEVSESAADASSMAAHFVKQEMGNDARRNEFMAQIEKLATETSEEPPSIVPADALPLGSARKVEKTEKTQKAEKVKTTATAKAKVVAKPKKRVIKQKKETAKKKTAENHDDVVVTITEAPKVEITKKASNK